MDFNFLEIFGGYSNQDLYEIIHKKEQYQAKAVEAARILLTQRNTSFEEMDQELHENNYTGTIQNVPAALHAPIAADLLDDYDAMSKNAKDKWYYCLVGILCFLALFQLYASILLFYKFFDFIKNDLFTLSYQAFILGYFSLTLMFIFKQKSIGWYVLFTQSMFSVITRAYFLLLTIVEKQDVSTDKIPSIIILLCETGIQLLLWKPSVMKLFKVKQTLRRNLLALVVLLAIAYIYFVHISL